MKVFCPLGIGLYTAGTITALLFMLLYCNERLQNFGKLFYVLSLSIICFIFAMLTILPYYRTLFSCIALVAPILMVFFTGGYLIISGFLQGFNSLSLYICLTSLASMLQLAGGLLLLFC